MGFHIKWLVSTGNDTQLFYHGSDATWLLWGDESKAHIMIKDESLGSISIYIFPLLIHKIHALLPWLAYFPFTVNECRNG